MSVAHTIGRSIGKTAAYAYEGTRLASTQLAAGAREGYAEKAAELRAAREQLAVNQPLVPVQRKLRTARA